RLAAADTIGNLVDKLHVYLKAATVYLGIHLLDDEFIAFSSKREFTLQVGIDAGNVMFVDVGPYFKSCEDIDLTQAFAGRLVLSNLCIERSKLTVYGRAKDEVVDFLSHQFQCCHAACIELLVLLERLYAPDGILNDVFTGKLNAL